jgi:hypothetical protein
MTNSDGNVSEGEIEFPNQYCPTCKTKLIDRDGHQFCTYCNIGVVFIYNTDQDYLNSGLEICPCCESENTLTLDLWVIGLKNVHDGKMYTVQLYYSSCSNCGGNPIMENQIRENERIVQFFKHTKFK